MTWAEIQTLFFSAVAEAPAAQSQKWLCINQGFRDVCAQMNVQELEEDVSVLTTTAGVDWVALPTAVFHVLSVHNTTSGIPVTPEASGMRGRERYYEQDTGMPVQGVPQFYAITAQRIYLRDTPDAVYELNLRYKIAPTTVSDSDLSSSPSLPDHLHMAIVWAAAAVYYRLHPDVNMAEGQPAPHSEVMEQAMQGSLARPMLPKDRERFDQRGRCYIPVYLRR